MSLTGRVALVTGASRGIGKGIAVELGKAGATVYVTGRPPQTRLNFPNTNTIDEVADQVTKEGGKGIPVYCDHSIPAQVEAVFKQIDEEQNGRLDILVNNAYAAVQFIGKNVTKKFYEIEDDAANAWDIVNNVGLRNHYICSVYGSRMMAKRKSGLIVTISSQGAIKKIFNVAYSTGKTACDKLAADIAWDLVSDGVTSISLWPGAVKTEIIEQTVLAGKGKTDPAIFADGETIYFSGICVAKLAADPNSIQMTGKTITTTELAERYGLTDIDGSLPKSKQHATIQKYLDATNEFRTSGILAKL